MHSSLPSVLWRKASRLALAGLLILALVIGFGGFSASTAQATEVDNGPTCVIYSDTLTEVAGLPAVEVPTPWNSRWTAVVDALAKWIWGEHPVAFLGDGQDEVETFTREFSVVDTASGATLIIAADNGYSVSINGNPVGEDLSNGPEGDHNYQESDSYSIPAEDLLVGTNVIEFVVTNYDEGNDTQNGNPAGLRYKLTVNGTSCGEPEPEPTNTCVVPDALQADGSVDVNDDIDETTLQEMLDDASYTVDVDDDQDNIQQWNGSNNTVNFSVDFIDGAAGDKHVFGYVKNGGAFVPVFKDDASIGGIYASIPVETAGPFAFSVSGVGDIVFAIHDVSSDKYYYTTTADNFDADQHAVVYNTADNEYVIAFEDLENLGDQDYNDLVVVVSVTSCKDEEAGACVIDAELIENGGFEANEVTSGSLWDIFPSGTIDLAWAAEWMGDDIDAPAVANIEIQEQGLNGWNATGAGNQWVELGSDWNGHVGSDANPEEAATVISQTIPTEVGAQYTVSFDFSARPQTASAQNEVDVYVDGALVYTAGPIATAGNQTQWAPHSFTFTATDSSALIEFADGGTPNDSLGTLVDNVSASCSAEPKDGPDEDEIRVIASKVVCTDESELPNWGAGNLGSIDADTAEDWVAEHDSCSLVPEWQFEWGDQSAPDMGNTFTGVSNHAEYNVFSGMVDIALDALEEGETEFHLREVLQAGYIPFTYNDDPQDPDGNEISAEFYCTGDVLHYDNWDFIRNPEGGETYYCVAFNAPKEHDEPATCDTGDNLFENGSFENPLVNNEEDWDVFANGTEGLEWMVEWLYPATDERPETAYLELQEDGFWSAANGEGQWAELDSNYHGPPGDEQLEQEASVAISQDIKTIPGKKYTLSFDFSPRPYTDAEENKVEVLANGELFGATPNVEGSYDDSGTAWDDYEYTFTATTTLTRFTLRDGGITSSLGGVTYGTFVDNAKLVCETPSEGDDYGTIVTKKYTSYMDGNFDFLIEGENLEEPIEHDASTSDGYGFGGSSDVEPGTYSVTEVEEDDWVLTGVSCIDDNGTKDDEDDYSVPNSEFEVEDGHTVTCSFYNVPAGEEETGTLRIVKNTTDGNGDFNFQIDGNYEGSLFAGITTANKTGSVDVELLPGSYNVTELAQSNWTLHGVECTYEGEGEGIQIENGHYIYINSDETVTCTFTNGPSGPNGGPNNGSDRVNRSGSVLGASTEACTPLLSTYMRLGAANDASEVMKLENFLNGEMSTTLIVDGIFDAATDAAVRAFQVKYWEDVLKPWFNVADSAIKDQDDSTGYVYKTTQWKINDLVCPGQPFPVVP